MITGQKTSRYFVLTVIHKPIHIAVKIRKLRAKLAFAINCVETIQHTPKLHKSKVKTQSRPQRYCGHGDMEWYEIHAIPVRVRGPVPLGSNMPKRKFPIQRESSCTTLKSSKQALEVVDFVATARSMSQKGRRRMLRLPSVQPGWSMRPWPTLRGEFPLKSMLSLLITYCLSAFWFNQK